MSNQTKKLDISSFLAQTKKLLSTGSYVLIPRKKNLQALADHGLSVADAKNEILSLVVDDYYKGPKKDYDPEQPGDIWEFKKTVDGEPFYVKIKIQNRNGKDVLKCLSFHEDDYS